MFIFAAAPADVNPTPAVVFALPAVAPEADESRPTAGPDFTPTAKEEAEAAELLNGDDEPDDAYWDARADDAHSLDAVSSGYSWL